MFILVGLYIHLAKVPRGTQFSDGYVSHFLTTLQGGVEMQRTL